ncbi:MAG TPA: FG-GAP-like repeat-containing protein [Gaiella sp.]|nr:FG-GAP-like repeat-containing protein [Gaiella sp.]
MSAPAIAAPARPSVRIRGTAYPVLLPTLRDPRLHLAGVIVTLQVLGQTAFDFQLSIAQILVSLATCAVLEVTIAFRRQKVLMWPASALLTGNGVAFVLRVPGTEHGDWWSMNGWWLFAGTAAVGLLSKYVITFRGRHIFNPSNIGLVACFVLFGPERADPLPFWWGPMSVWLAIALVLIVGGGLAILSRLHLVPIAAGFWLTFAAGVAILAATGHEMTAAWHLGPIGGRELWRTLVTSPEVLVFLFFMITDPRTIPETRRGRLAYAISVGLLAPLLIAPWTTEFSAKLAVLGSLTIVCAARPLLLLAGGRDPVRSLTTWTGNRSRRLRLAGLGATALVAGGAVVAAGLLSPAAPQAPLVLASGRIPQVTVATGRGVAAIDGATAQRVATALVADLQGAAESLRTRDRLGARRAATGPWLADLWRRIDAGRGGAVDVVTYDAEHVRLRLERGKGQGPPSILATLTGTSQSTTYGRSASAIVRRGPPRPVVRTFVVVPTAGRYLVSDVRGEAERAPAQRASILARFSLTDVAPRVGLDFRHGAFRYGMSVDTGAMMGGGLCWLDYDGDGWQDLYVVNSYADSDRPGYGSHGGLPSSRLYRNVEGHFVDVTASTRTGLRMRGSGCVAADLDGNGTTDLVVTTASFDVGRNAYDALLWNNGDGTFTEGAKAAGIDQYGWHTGAAVDDVNGDGRLDLFVAGYTDVNHMLPGSQSGFPANHGAVRDLLFLNEGGPGAHPRFREVGRAAGLEPRQLDHGLGATFTDVDGDGRPDLYLANDLDPNRLYLNEPWPGGAAADPRGLGFRLVERGRAEAVADPNAGMGIAAGDYSGDGRDDLFVTNSRGQLHAAYRSRAGKPFADVRPEFAPALGQRFTGWGASWADLDLDGSPELLLANGAIPVTSLVKDAQRLRVVTTDGGDVRELRTGASGRRNGRGLAVADFDNDGDPDVAVATIGGRLQLYRNDGARGHWLEVSLRRFVPGATVTAVLPGGRRLVRVARAGSSYLSSEDPRLLFGLGNASSVREIVVRYPGGRITRIRATKADRLVVAD